MRPKVVLSSLRGCEAFSRSNPVFPPKLSGLLRPKNGLAMTTTARRPPHNDVHATTKVAGYTLIEILIVMFIISIVTSVALLTIGHNENKRMEAFATELTQLLGLAEEQAMLQPVVLGVRLNQKQVQFTRFVAPTEKEKNSWRALDDKIFATRAIPSGMQVDVKLAGQVKDNAKENPQIIVSTNGEITPFTIYVGKKGEKPRYAVVGEPDGTIHTKDLS
jgi:general secretion pathway protein H